MNLPIWLQGAAFDLHRGLAAGVTNPASNNPPAAEDGSSGGSSPDTQREHSSSGWKNSLSSQWRYCIFQSLEVYCDLLLLVDAQHILSDTAIKLLPGLFHTWRAETKPECVASVSCRQTARFWRACWGANSGCCSSHSAARPRAQPAGYPSVPGLSSCWSVRGLPGWQGAWSERRVGSGAVRTIAHKGTPP